MTSIFFNLLIFGKCHNLWSILESVPYVLEKNVYSSVLDGMFCIYLLSPFGVRCYQTYYFFIDFLPRLFIHCWKWHNKVLYCYNMAISPLGSVNICFIYLGITMFGVYIFTTVISSWWVDLFTLLGIVLLAEVFYSPFFQHSEYIILLTPDMQGFCWKNVLIALSGFFSMWQVAFLLLFLGFSFHLWCLPI